jgi:Radical SAM superfamily
MMSVCKNNRQKKISKGSNKGGRADWRPQGGSPMKITLIHPPLDDPTIPYHSTAYLAGHLYLNGFTDVGMRDLNIEFVNYCIEPDVVNAFYEEGDRRMRLHAQAANLGFQDQEQYYALSSAPRVDAAEIQKAAMAFRQRDTFLDYSTYIGNVNRLTAYFGFLGALSYPADIESFTIKTRGRISVYNLADLFNADLAARVCSPLVRYFENRLCDDVELARTDLFGISIVYDHQLFYAVHLARLFKQRWPEKRLVLGGTAISQLYKYLKDKSLMKRFFALCDAVVIGEGETAICQIAASAETLFDGSPLMNTITCNRDKDTLVFPPLSFEDVSTLGAPIYQHPWDLYLSPERGINYSPTRGCYWSRCTFCDYGLNNDRPTSPWRERGIDQVIADLKKAQTDHGIKYVYLAVDVMAPGYLERFSDAVIAAGLDIRWGAEIRMEKIFTPERCMKLADSGCVSMSFGMESGNQRILDLIDKGTKVAFMGETMKNFSQAGIAVQIMAFTDFPTETTAEKAATYKFVEDNSDSWAAGGIGQFLLTGTSLVAKNPAKFGITLADTQDADVARAIAYSVDTSADLKTNLTEDIDGSFHDPGNIFPILLRRPWAGGTDTLHSMIYFATYGSRFFRQHALDKIAPASPSGRDAILKCTMVVNGTLTESGLDLSEIFKNRDRFVSYLRERMAIPAEPTYGHFCEWESGVSRVGPSGDMKTYWLVSAREAVKLARPVYKILALADQQKLTIAQLLKGSTGELTNTLIEYFIELQKRGLLSFIVPGESRWNRFTLPDERIIRTSESEVLAPIGRLN